MLGFKKAKEHLVQCLYDIFPNQKFTSGRKIYKPAS